MSDFSRVLVRPKILGFKAMIGLRKGLEQLTNKFWLSNLSQISWVK